MHDLALISLLLRYPDADVLAERDETRRRARALAPSPATAALVDFVDWWAAEPADALERRYVETFDFARRTALDLTYYTYGDRRQRGLALVALRRRYAAEGLDLETNELPDHLPVMLEFAAAVPEEGARLIAEYRPVIELLRLALERGRSPYAGALQALCLSLPPLNQEDIDELHRMAEEGPPMETVGLEPFAPPEVMPEPRVRTTAGCGVPAGGGGR